MGAHTNRVKAINSQVQSMTSKIIDVPIYLSKWEGKTALLAVSLDNFVLILEMDYLKTIKATAVPHFG